MSIGSTPLGSSPIGSLRIVQVSTFAAVMLIGGGQLFYNLSATSSSNKLYLNNGQFVTRLSAVTNDKLITVNNGQLVAT